MASSQDFESAKKKRGSERQLDRDNPDEEGDDADPGNFAKASETVLAERRIVKVRRSGVAGGASSLGVAPANPFAGLSRLPFSGFSAPVLGDSGGESLLGGGAAPKQCEGVTKDQEVHHAVEEVHSDGEPTKTEDMAKGVEVDVACGLEKSETATPVASSEKKETSQEEVSVARHASSALPTEEDKPGVDHTVASQEMDGKVCEVQDKAEGKLNGDDGVRVDEEERCKEKDNANAGHLEASAFKELAPSGSGFAGLSSGTNAFSSTFGASFSFSGSSLVAAGSSLPSSPAFGDFSFNGGSTFGKVASEGEGALPSLSSVFGESKGGMQLFGGSFGAAGTSCGASFGTAQPASVVCLSEVPVETGEEEESPFFSADAILYEFAENATWKERGKGELRLNVPNVEGRSARLVMRAKGNYRLLLNAYLYPDMKLTRMDGRGVTFACRNNSSGTTSQMKTCALKFKDASIVDGFTNAVECQKGQEASKQDEKRADIAPSDEGTASKE
eukprot:TRINITY_DN2575_c0_g3_i1.p1 TRINITY_DN2575_c0_g3~~TRINITY_DN2575_c0_g3_i1.p1  ORF type:complete len:503 (+),score=136.54 TRINITY_DN2575_c0_g3_i1:121-1629(+)